VRTLDKFEAVTRGSYANGRRCSGKSVNLEAIGSQEPSEVTNDHRRAMTRASSAPRRDPLKSTDRWPLGAPSLAFAASSVLLRAPCG
jgi:hypothetical protein